jgi:outer membrane protein assembly factor BamB
MHLLVLAFLFSAGLADSVSSENIWPQWRGPTGDSVASARELPTRWSKTQNVIWKTPLPGWGNSTPAIWLDKVFITTQQDERLLVLQLDRRSGQVVWQREVGRGTPRRQGELGNFRFHDEHNMATPSPVTDGQHVWFHFGSGDLACFDFAGEQVWATNLVQKYGPYTIWWGHANSPVLVGDLLISACMQDPKGGGRSYVVAHDKLTGEEKWLVERDTGAEAEAADSYTTPILCRHGGQTELIVFGGNVLDAYEPQSGRRLWHCDAFKGNRVISGPTLAGGTIYAVQGMRGPLFAVRAGGSGDVTATNVCWQYRKHTPDASSPLVRNGLVFLATNDGFGVCLDAATGTELWTQRLGRAFRASPLAAGGEVYFFDKEGKCTVVEAARQFKIVSQANLDEEIIASPAVAAGDLFLRTRERMYRIGYMKRTGPVVQP